MKYLVVQNTKKDNSNVYKTCKVQKNVEIKQEKKLKEEINTLKNKNKDSE